MWYSAEIWADFRKYERFSGTMDIHEACWPDPAERDVGQGGAEGHVGRIAPREISLGSVAAAVRLILQLSVESYRFQLLADKPPRHQGLTGC